MSVGPTRVLVLSDTHVTAAARLPTAVLRLAEQADHVLHGGDLVADDVLDVLRAFAPVDAVLGNCDGPELAARLDATVEVEIGGVPIAMVHDAGPTRGRHERLRARFPHARVVVYGHSHLPELARTEGLLVLNPGSPTQRRRAPTHTVAWLELADETVVDARIVHLDDLH